MTNSSADGLPPLREVIQTHNLTAKKSLGQNFILDLNLTTKIAQQAGPLDNRLVVEIGPGPGGLTRGLLQAGARKVIAIERDRRCLPALEQISQHYPGQLVVHNADAVTINWLETLAPHLSEETEKVVIAANLPYGIATKLLIGWLETDPWPPWFSSMALMFQKEVAERIVASPSTKSFGRLSIISQWRCATEIVMSLGPEAFTPAPKVASAIVKFVPHSEPVPNCNVQHLGQISRAIFGQRRKMLRKSLQPIFRNTEYVLTQLGIDPSARGETLSVEQIAEIAEAME